jgi:hypothetical protein
MTPYGRPGKTTHRRPEAAKGRKSGDSLDTLWQTR